jgi:hypothetical protein
VFLYSIDRARYETREKLAVKRGYAFSDRNKSARRKSIVMHIRRCLILAFVGLILAAGGAQAQQAQRLPQCDKPPYGMPVADYEFLTSHAAQIDGGLDYILLAMPLCYIKAHIGSRKAWYELGFSDHDIDTKSAAILLLENNGAARALYYKKHGYVN